MSTDDEAFYRVRGIPLTIQKGIAPPPGMNPRGRPLKTSYPVALMEVGDSFFVPLNGESYTKVAQRLPKPHRYAPMKFRRQREGDGIRFWRIA